MTADPRPHTEAMTQMSSSSGFTLQVLGMGDRAGGVIFAKSSSPIIGLSLGLRFCGSAPGALRRKSRMNGSLTISRTASRPASELNGRRW